MVPRSAPTTGRNARSRPTVSETLVRLRSTQKPSAGTPLYSRLVNRPLGRLLAALAVAAGLGPNTVSLVSAATTYSGIAVLAFATPTPWVGVLVTALLVLGYALDSADGQVARVTVGGSVLGEWLDHLLDAVKIASLHAAVAWSALHHTEGSARVGIALAYGVVACVMFFGMILTDQLRRANGVPKDTATSGSSDLVRSLAVLPSDYGVLCFAFLLFGVPSLFYPVYGLLGLGTALLLVVALARWVRQLHAVDLAGRAT